MAFITLRKSFLAYLSVIIFGTTLNAQNAIYKVPLAKQVELSTQIIEGTVISKSTFWDETYSYIFTAYTIEVSKVFKGNSVTEVQIISEGGVIGLEAQVVSHSLQLNKGEIGTFMLSNHNYNINTNISNSPSFKAVSDIQGFYKYHTKTDKVVNTFSETNGISNNFYNAITKETNTNFVEVKALDLSHKSTSGTTKSAAAMSSLTASDYSAGTKSILTIDGTGFGISQGTVGFSNANYGGSLHTDALDNQIISWEDNKIEVEIPYIAGTGTVMVNTMSNGSIESSDILPIDYAQINLETDIGQGLKAYQTQLVEMNVIGGYTWTMNTNFSNDQNAVNAFTRAFDNWSCSTGVNWEIDGSTTTSVSSAANDDVNVITFDSNLSSGVLGRCTSYYQGCIQNGELKWYVKEMDIVFNPNKTWNFTTGVPVSGEVDFESVALHELGHGHQLGHVVDNNEVMHYSLSSGVAKRDLSIEDLAGALDVQDRSINTPVCSQTTLTASTCYSQSLSNNDFELLSEIEMYPNPSNGRFFIKNNTQVNIQKVQIYDILGKVVYINSNINTRREQIVMDGQKRGVYIVKIETDFGSISKKLIIR